MKDEDKKSLYKSIGEGNEEAIIQILENLIDTEDSRVSQIIQELLKFYHKPI